MYSRPRSFPYLDTGIDAYELANGGINIEHNHAVFIAVANRLFAVVLPPSRLQYVITVDMLLRARW